MVKNEFYFLVKTSFIDFPREQVQLWRNRARARLLPTRLHPYSAAPAWACRQRGSRCCCCYLCEQSEGRCIAIIICVGKQVRGRRWAGAGHVWHVRVRVWHARTNARTANVQAKLAGTRMGLPFILPGCNEKSSMLLPRLLRLLRLLWLL